MATYGSWQATIQNEFGDILPSADVEVILESTGLPATIYSGRTGGALANPFPADTNGFAQFYAATGEYRVTATDSGSGFTNTWRYVEAGGVLGLDAKLNLSGGTLTGTLNVEGSSSPTVSINPDSAGGFPQFILKDSNGVSRGLFVLGESTGEVSLNRYDAVGALEAQFTLKSDGNVNVLATAPTANDHLTRKDYVDGRTSDVYLAVGTYAFMSRLTVGSDIVGGQIYTGAQISPCGVSVQPAGGQSVYSGGVGGPTPGSWIAMGRCNNTAGAYPATLFKRIA